MLFSLSVKNFKKSIRDYSIYFFTMILGIAVFYIFNAIETQTAMMEVTKIKAAIIDMMNGVMDGVSIFVSFILGYLIVYASRFMLKKRKMELGVYDPWHEQSEDCRNFVDESNLDGSDFSGGRTPCGYGDFSVYVADGFSSVSGRCVQICVCDFLESSGEIYPVFSNYLYCGNGIEYHCY